jgi:hypothetical protein
MQRKNADIDDENKLRIKISELSKTELIKHVTYKFWMLLLQLQYKTLD